MEKLANRFLKKIDRNGPIHPTLGTQCWLWTDHKGRGGYGRITVAKQTRLAHRISWELHRGPIPPGLHVLHHCDNPGCVNPFHLFLGTVADNMADRDSKGRHTPLPGEKHGCAKLTEGQVREIRSRYRKGDRAHGGKALAHDYGVTPAAISLIVLGRKWKHVSEQPPCA